MFVDISFVGAWAPFAPTVPAPDFPSGFRGCDLATRRLPVSVVLPGQFHKR